VNITIRNKKRSKAFQLSICFLWQAITLKPIEIVDCLELDDEGNFCE